MENSPRDPKFQLMHPFDAFEDSDFLAAVRTEAVKLRRLVAKTLQQKYNKYSKQEETRRNALTKGEEDLPPGRDWVRCFALTKILENEKI
jgi:aprataxin